MMEVYVLGALLLPWGAFGGFVDMDTPLDKRTTKSLVDDTVYHLIMSDEFNTPNQASLTGTILSGLLWTNPMTIRRQWVVDLNTFTILPSYLQQRMAC